MEYIPPTIDSASGIIKEEEILDDPIAISVIVLVYITASIEFTNSKEDDIFVKIETPEQSYEEPLVHSYVFFDNSFNDIWLV